MTPERIISRLEDLFKRLERPETLDAAALEELNNDWLTATRRLDALPEEEMKRAGAFDPFLKVRLELLVERLPRIREGLISCKGEVSQQLMAQNRRLQSARRGYGRKESGLVLVRYQA
ncbi:MAG: hypothetical protein HQL76_07500 [Magnetococcales bacterium]|nr:hypothetical protein [Magnetococcales bacterium]